MKVFSQDERYRVIIFFNDSESLNVYLHNFLADNITVRGDRILYKSEHIEIVCIKGFGENNLRGYKADIIAVQEELTWRDDWQQIQNRMLKPMLVNQVIPVDIQIFESVKNNGEN